MASRLPTTIATPIQVYQEMVFHFLTDAAASSLGVSWVPRSKRFRPAAPRLMDGQLTSKFGSWWAISTASILDEMTGAISTEVKKLVGAGEWVEWKV